MTSSKPQISEPMMAAVMTESCEAKTEKQTAMEDLWKILMLACYVIYHVKCHYLQYFYFNSSQSTIMLESSILSSNRKLNVLKDYHDSTIITKPWQISLNQTYLTWWRSCHLSEWMLKSYLNLQYNICRYVARQTNTRKFNNNILKNHTEY